MDCRKMTGSDSRGDKLLRDTMHMTPIKMQFQRNTIVLLSVGQMATRICCVQITHENREINANSLVFLKK